MRINDYQERANETAIYPGQGDVDGLVYTTLGAVGEAGEIANKVKKILRDDDGFLTEAKRAELSKEIGDVLWYLAMTCTELDISLEEVASLNLTKLGKRKDLNTLQGSGDNR